MTAQWNFKTIIEPFKIKVIEPIKFSTRKEREELLKKAHYNLFNLKSSEVIIDLLTDSGTSAMSEDQWSGIMLGDESYAGATSWEKFYEVIYSLTGMPYIMPVHQGRAAEKILYNVIGGKGKVFYSNTHFDTTRANIEFTGAKAIDLPCPQSENLYSDYKFKGNIDCDELEQRLKKKLDGDPVGVIITATNNTGGGQPVSLSNIQEVKAITQRYNVLLIIDACRIAENSYFVKEYELNDKSISYFDIAKKIISLADICIFSAKKDGLSNIGGFLAMKDPILYEKCIQHLILTEGFVTYGGLAGRDLEAIAIGIKEAFQPEYLLYRIRSIRYLAEHLSQKEIPVVWPPGGHAVYVVAHDFLPHIKRENFPGHALACELYLEGGIRACEIGSVMFGKYDDNKKFIPAKFELLRLAIPRRVYTQAHIDYVIEVFERIKPNKHKIKGFKIIKESPFLRHFTAHFEPII